MVLGAHKQVATEALDRDGMEGDATVLWLINRKFQYMAGPAALDLGLRGRGLIADTRRHLNARQGKWREPKVGSGDAKGSEQG